MINNRIISSVFSNYGIDSVILVEDNNKLNFVISNMNSSISLDRWEYLENILKDITQRDVNIMPLNQVLSHLGSDYISKGVVIQWKTVMNY